VRVVAFGFDAAFVAGFRFVAARALVAALRVADVVAAVAAFAVLPTRRLDADVAARAAFAVELARRDVVAVADLAALATLVAVDATLVFAAAALAVAARRRPEGLRAVDFVADADDRRADDALTGETAVAARAAADPALLAAPPTTVAAPPAAEPARCAMRLPIAATSAVASPACFRRLATCFLPFEVWALASWARRLVSVARAVAS
jgi:hypothetical protein